MGALNVLWGRGSEDRCEPYAIGLYFPHRSLGREQEGPREVHFAIHADEEVSGGTHGEDEYAKYGSYPLLLDTWV